MLLTIDIGNTNVLAGCFENDLLLHECRLKTDPYRTVDEYGSLLFSLWRERFGDSFSFDAVVLSSVVPALTQTFRIICEERIGVAPVVVGPGVKTGLVIRAKDPASLGADRVVNAVAAKSLYGSGVIVIDFGTATSFDILDNQCRYLGGIIAPGIEIAVDALVSRTAKLPRVDLVWPDSVVGGNTVAAMQSGCLVGYVSMIEGLVKRVKQEVEGIRTVVATGGLSERIAAHTQCIDTCNRNLTLEGMKILAAMNVMEGS